MHLTNSEELARVIDEACQNRSCVQVWLGHGDALFLGLDHETFSEYPLSVIGNPMDRTMPEFQFRTKLAHWYLERSSLILGSSCDDPMASDAIEHLLGRPVVSWEFTGPDIGIRLTFTDDLSLRIERYELADEKDRYRDAWAIRDPNGLYHMITCNGYVYVQDEVEPCLQNALRPLLFPSKGDQHGRQVD
jgi:hypothetical protein